MLFTSRPLHRAYEYMMRQVPRYRPDSSEYCIPDFYIGAYGTYLRKLSYWQAGSEETSKAADGKPLPWNTLIILMASPFRNPLFEKRIQNEILTENEGDKMIYKSYIHRRVFKQAVRERAVSNRIFLAVLFLLTANHTFWNRVKAHVTMDTIRFENFPMNNCTTEEYTLFCCAKDLCTGSRHITVADLADTTVVSKEVFNIICNAMTIARYGLPAVDRQSKKGASTT